jgi:hypothetical protein
MRNSDKAWDVVVAGECSDPDRRRLRFLAAAGREPSRRSSIADWWRRGVTACGRQTGVARRAAGSVGAMAIGFWSLAAAGGHFQIPPTPRSPASAVAVRSPGSRIPTYPANRGFPRRWPKPRPTSCSGAPAPGVCASWRRRAIFSGHPGTGVHIAGRGWHGMAGRPARWTHCVDRHLLLRMKSGRAADGETDPEQCLQKLAAAE